MFKNKKALAFLALLWIIPLVMGLSIGAFIGVSKWYESIKTPEIDGIKLPDNAVTVQKECFIEGGCQGVEDNEKHTESPQVFGRTCEDLHKDWGTDVYFQTLTGNCVSCKDYFTNGQLPEQITSSAYPTLEQCQTILCDPSNMLEINSEDDCSKIADATCIDVISYEKYCGSNPQEQKCPDIKIAGVLPFPDLWCKFREWLKELFLPFKIAISVLATISAWLFSFFTLKNIDFKTSKKTKNAISWIVSVLLGLIVGTLIWFYWYIGLFILIALFVVKMFIWR